jgi:hypothetical protein
MFTITIQSPNGSVRELFDNEAVEGSQISWDILEFLEDLEPGDEIRIRRLS